MPARHFRILESDWLEPGETPRGRFQLDDDFGAVRRGDWIDPSTSLVDADGGLTSLLPSDAGANTISGGSGPETLSGGGSGDTITGGAGNDTIYGYGPDDTDPNSGAIAATRVATGLSSPIFASSPPGDPDRLFIVEQHSGQIRILDLTTGVVSATPFLDIPDAQLAGGGEQGLLGMAFHPDYATNGKFYLYMTVADGDIEVREYTRSANPNVANTTFTVVLAFDHPSDTNHNGGWLGFGPDGYLYIAVGDGGGGGDVNNYAQNLNSYLGKMLRIDVDGDDYPADANRNYAIPEENPFAGATAGLDEIWAYGLRNPWRCSFDPVTGGLYIADVGQGQREEVNFVPAGTPGGINFGWHVMEGDLPYDTNTPGNPPANDPSLWDPTVVYAHNGTTGGFSITGGYAYYGPGGAQGVYFFADYVSGHIWTASIGDDGQLYDFTMRDTQIQASAGTVNQISSFAVDGQGRLYVIGLDGEIFRLTPSSAASDGADTLSGGDGDDLVYGGAGADILNGDANNDRLTGGLGNDTLNGGTGDDVLDGGAGNDSLTGGADTDTADYRAATAAVTVNLTLTGAQNTVGAGTDTLAGIERVLGSAFNDALTGDSAANTLDGKAGNDTLSGGAGGDILIGGAGADALDGGADLDYASYINATAGVGINLTSGVHSGDALGDTFANIERYRLSAFADIFTGGAASDYAYGAEGNDTLNGAGGIDRLYGQADADTLNGDAGNDILIGGTGADVLNGGADRDTASYETMTVGVTINLASGVHTGDATGDTFTSIEILWLTAFNDTFTGGNAVDEVRGADGIDTLNGGDGADILRGENGNDVLNGDDGDDFLYGGAGSDQLNGGAGVDTASYLLASSGVSINLNTGTHAGEAAFDTFVSIERFQLSNGFSLVDNFNGSIGADWVAGYKGVDNLNGMAGNDTLNGGEHNDVIDGGADNDKLIGGTGNDSLTGGTGADQFWANAGLFGADTVNDFENGVDKVRLTGISGVTSFANLTITTNGGGWAVITLPDGSSITLTGITAGQVDASDFLFV